MTAMLYRTRRQPDPGDPLGDAEDRPSGSMLLAATLERELPDGRLAVMVHTPWCAAHVVTTEGDEPGQVSTRIGLRRGLLRDFRRRIVALRQDPDELVRLAVAAQDAERRDRPGRRVVEDLLGVAEDASRPAADRAVAVALVAGLVRPEDE